MPLAQSVNLPRNAFGTCTVLRAPPDAWDPGADRDGQSVLAFPAFYMGSYRTDKEVSRGGDSSYKEDPGVR